jgi:hypothetical protein
MTSAPKCIRESPKKLALSRRRVKSGWESTFLEALDQPLRRETKRVAIKYGHIVGDQQDADDDKEKTTGHVNGSDITAQTVRELKKRKEKIPAAAES